MAEANKKECTFIGRNRLDFRYSAL
jgi:hypothetical protein